MVTSPVLIVGGGVTGLSGALFLAWHGIPCVLVERHPDLLIHPRARRLTPRTVEIYRQIGLEPAIEAAAYAGKEFRWSAILADTLNDETYSPADEPFEDDGLDASPSSFGSIDQDKLELLLRDLAREMHVDLRFSTELISFEHDADGVTSHVRDDDGEYVIRSDYVIAADGQSASIRRTLGIGATGPGPLFDTITAIVEADLGAAVRGRPVNIAHLRRPRPNTILMAHDTTGRRWVYGTAYSPRTEALADFTEERVAEMVRAAAGLPGIPVTLRPQIPGTDRKVLAFSIRAQVADRYAEGRIFIIGDAAHAVPPTGGLGANTGIQDAHNLAWKLAAVIKGQAGAGLLDTYDAERRPTGLLTMRQALARFGTRVGPGTDIETLAYDAIIFGYQYRSTAVHGVTGADQPLRPGDLTGQPGTRAPHVPITRDGVEISTIDLYGKGFVLLAGPTGTAWTEAELPVPVEAYRFGVDLGPAQAAAAHGIGPEGALLVRPDGFVAWRSPDAGRTTELENAVRGILSL